MSAGSSLATFVATGAGSGLLPVAPGTWGSALAVALAAAVFASGGGVVAFAVLALLVSVAGFWATDVYLRTAASGDPGEVVVDEMAGQWLALAPVALLAPGDWRLWAAAFVLFRLFDIWKPWPVSAAESWGGALGVMADDLVAGAIAALLIFGVVRLDVLG